MWNLKNILIILINKIVKGLHLEQQELFCYLILLFISGVITASIIFETHNLIIPTRLTTAVLIIGGALLVVLLILKLFSVNKINKAILLTIFFLLGYLVFCYKALTTQTTILNEPLKFVHLTGEVQEVRHKIDSKLTSIYLNHIKVHNYHNLPEFQGLRLVTYKPIMLHPKETITVWAHLDPIYATTPYINFWKVNAYWRKVSANGFIVSAINTSKPKVNNQKSILKTYQQFLKQYLSHKIDNNLSQQSAGIIKAAILGDYTSLIATQRKSLIKAGLNPFLAISGLHIGIITGFLFLLIRGGVSLCAPIALRVNTKKLAALGTIILLTCYLLLVSNIPSALRAGLMAILYMIGVIFGFYTLSIRNLLLAIFILLIFKPEYISYPSFWLSFLATAVIIKLFNNAVIKRLLQQRNKNIIFGLLKYLILTAGLSLTISITLFPVVMYFFNEVPLYGAIANLFITPLFSFIIMPFSFIALILPEPLSLMPFYVVDWSVKVMLQVATYISDMQSPTMYAPMFGRTILFSYIIMFLIFIISNSKLKYLALSGCLGLIAMICLLPYPHIMIDQHMKVLAFLNDETKKYVFTTLRQGASIRKGWIKNYNMVEKQGIKHHKNYHCDDQTNCFFNIENFTILYNNTTEYLHEVCVEANVLITTIPYDNKCHNLFVIDKKFLQKYGSVFIYVIKPDQLKIVSHHKTIWVKIN